MLQTLIVQAASLAGVGVLVFVAWALGFRRSAQIKDETTVRALAAAEGEALDAVLIDAQGRTALALTTNGALFAAKAVGGDIAVRVASWADVRVRRTGAVVRVAFPGLAWDDLSLTLDAGADAGWIERLNPES